MEPEGSPILDIMGDEPEEPWLEMSATGSLSEDSSGSGSGDIADAEAEDLELWTTSNLHEAMTSSPQLSLWVVSDSWSPWDISPRAQLLRRGRRLFQSRPMTKPSYLKNFLVRGFGCRRIYP
jgi:hypothetical protein